MKRSIYLASSAAGALGVVNAYHPVIRRGWGPTASFASGWVETELPRAMVAAHGSLIVGATRSGLLRTRSGQVATALNVASMAGLTHLYRVSQRSGDVLEAALTDELGPGYRARQEPSPYAAFDRAPARRWRVPVGFAGRCQYVTTAGRDIAYGDAGRRNRLDVWRRSDLPDDARAPVLVQVHGGAWVMGEKNNQALPLLSHLAQRGWVCVAITYRLSPRATWPDLIADVMKALAWTKANIDRFGGDPGFVAITGGSAGGHLAALAALAACDPAFQPGFESADTSVNAAVPFYGVYDWLNRHGTKRDNLLPLLERKVVKQTVANAREVFDRASPLSRVHAGAPPFFILHGTNDSLVAVEQARSFAEELRKVSNNHVVYAELPFAQHAFDLIRSPRTRATVEAVQRFLEFVYAEHVRAARGIGSS
jgi:acetyl esterase/lipase